MRSMIWAAVLVHLKGRASWFQRPSVGPWPTVEPLRIHNRLRDWHDGNHPAYALACWLRDYKEQVFLFTPELRRELDE